MKNLMSNRRPAFVVLLVIGCLFLMSGLVASHSNIPGSAASTSKPEASTSRTYVAPGEKQLRKINKPTTESVTTSAPKALATQSPNAFDIPSFVIAGGGGTSTSVSPNFRLDGTAGQPAAGTTSTGGLGQFSITGGFWQQQPTATLSISGTILYCASAAPPGAINTTVSLSGNVTASTATDVAGSYSFTNLPAPGTYTVTPSKTGAVSGINSTDVSRILQFIAGTLTFSACQQRSADTSQNSTINSTDASQVLNFIAGNPPAANNHAGEWRFNPAFRDYVGISSNQTNQDYEANLLGEVSGNWTPAGPSSPPEGSGVSIQRAGLQAPLVPCGNPPIPVSLANASVSVGLTNFTLPITIGNTTGESITGFDLRFTYDAAIVGLQASPVSQTGTLSSGMTVTTNTSTPGLLIIVGAQATPITGSGTLINVNFTRLGALSSSTSLTWTRTELNDAVNDCIHPATPINGNITIGPAPSASNGIVAGRITNEQGMPVSGAVIRLSGTQTRKTITDANGNYMFENVETNGFYTVTPSRSNFTFSPSLRSFNQLAERTEAAFGASFTGDAANPLDTAEYFVRQQYVDVLGREPDEGGFNYWSDQLLGCGSDANCLSTRRRDVAAAFFIEAEFQRTGSFIHGLYDGGLGRKPLFAEFTSDRLQLIAGANLDEAKQRFAEAFVARPEFAAKYQRFTTGDLFVDALLTNAGQAAGVDLSGERANLLRVYNAGASQDQSRSAVIRALVDIPEFHRAEYNPAFVITEYFAYLRRDPDRGGYDFWLDVLNNRAVNSYRSMVCAFITSREYQQRFSSVVSRTNAECGQ